MGDKAKKIGELEKKVKETEEKYIRTDKQLTIRKDRVNKLEKQVSQFTIHLNFYFTLTKMTTYLLLCYNMYNIKTIVILL